MGVDPTVSIIIAAFNAERHIGDAIASALAQVDVPLETIVIDDASTDRTVEVVEQCRDGRTSLIRLPRNLGPAGARNAGLKAAKGAWISVLDADDLMAPTRIASLLAVAGEADVIADNLIVRSARAERLLIDESLDGGLEVIGFADFVLNNRPYAGDRPYGYLKPVFRASFLQQHGLAYDPNLRIGEDFMLVAEMLARGGVYLRSRTADYVYTEHPDSISHRLSAATAGAMADADTRFVAKYGPSLSRENLAAMRAHQRSLRRAGAFAGLVEDLKRGRLASAAVRAARDPSAVPLLALPVGKRLGAMARRT